jgi:hypothetical protein
MSTIRTCRGGYKEAMRPFRVGLALAGFAALFLSACGGGDGSISGGSNRAPTANAGAAQTVNSGASVTLNGSASSDSDGSIATYAWTQTAGGAVVLSSSTSAQPTFTAPTVTSATTLTFSLVVTDNRGAPSAASTVNVTVNPSASNQPPTANAGSAQTVNAGVTVALNGSASSDTDGSIASYAWTQTAGSAVTLSSSTAAQPTFTAPTVANATTLTFSLVVTDNGGASSAASTVNVTVNPIAAGNVLVSGKVRFERVNFLTTGTLRPLDYANPVLRPARGVIVRALNGGTLAEIATGSTDANGDYTLSVPSSTDVLVEVVARMQKSGPAPTWDVRVQDGIAGNSPYTHRTAAFGSAAGVTRNIDIPTGISASGTATGATRPSGPFAILDTVYTAQQAVIGVSPAIVFPALIVDWGTQNAGTFFSTQTNQHIALLADLTEDTDEFDQHVVAHEFGHYIESNFSRADNIGGAHGLGDRLDPRVAFGEGFGYAFAAIVLNDPIARDSFFGDVTPNDGIVNPVHASGGFNVETNPSTSPPGIGNDREGCWCSESSVWSILYDIYDSPADGNDTLALGLQPIWNVLIGDQKNTPALTTIFSFVTALKASQPGSAAAINTLVGAQNIDAANINAFATTETHFPNSGTVAVAQTAALPIYTTTTLGAASTVLRNVDDAGNYNKVGNHRFVRFNVPSARNVTIDLATSNATNNDPDYVIYRIGDFVNSGENPPPGPENHTFNLAAGDYVLDVYDCANGCSGEQGTAGDYDLTLTIN